MGGEQPIGLTSDFQCNYLKCRQNLPERRTFGNSKVREGQSLFRNGRIRAARFLTLATRMLSKEMRFWKLPKNRVFSISFFPKTGLKIFCCQPNVTTTLTRCRGLLWDTHWSSFSGDESRSKLRTGQKHVEKLLYIYRVPWPEHLSTTKRTLKSSHLRLKATQWASRSTILIGCL